MYIVHIILLHFPENIKLNYINMYTVYIRDCLYVIQIFTCILEVEGIGSDPLPKAIHNYKYQYPPPSPCRKNLQLYTVK